MHLVIWEDQMEQIVIIHLFAETLNIFRKRLFDRTIWATRNIFAGTVLANKFFTGDYDFALTRLYC